MAAIAETTAVPDPEAPARAILAEQNDIFRRALGRDAVWNGQVLQGMVVTTPGFRALPDTLQARLVAEVICFADFNEDNDPWGDHGFAVVEIDGTRIFWKIDLYDTDYSFGAGTTEDATDPEKTRRVLTLYLPSEH